MVASILVPHVLGYLCRKWAAGSQGGSGSPMERSTGQQTEPSSLKPCIRARKGVLQPRQPWLTS